MISSDLIKEVEVFFENTDTEKLSRGLRNMLLEYLAQNTTGLSIYLDGKFFNDLENLFILLDKEDEKVR